MLKKYVFSLTPQEPETMSLQMGSIFHGIFMDYLPEAVATYLHAQALRPYSQYILVKNGQAQWHFHVLTKDMMDIMDRLSHAWDGLSVISRQRQKKYTLVLEKVSEPESYQSVCRRFFIEKEVKRTIPLYIQTPIAFKSQGEYINWPDTDLLVRNLYNRWNAFSDAVIFEDEEVLAFLQDSCRLGFYKLASTRFDLEGHYVPAMQGRFSLRVKGNDMAARWLNLLAYYATYAGIGIKTAIGMGGVRGEESK